MHIFFMHVEPEAQPNFLFFIFLGLDLAQLIQPVQPSHQPKLVTRLGHTPTRNKKLVNYNSLILTQSSINLFISYFYIYILFLKIQKLGYIKALHILLSVRICKIIIQCTMRELNLLYPQVQATCCKILVTLWGSNNKAKSKSQTTFTNWG